jgi:sulfoxide reductase heme-binding subunit YedZ
MIVAATELEWYLTRSSGFVALILLTASIAVGVLTMARRQPSAWPRFVTQVLHRNVSLLAICFLGAHIATTVLDGFAPIGWLDAVIPFASPYRRIWLGLGALAVDALLAITVSSLLRRHIGYRVWLGIHLTSWIAWPLAIVHGLGTGSDSQAGWGQVVYLGCAAAVLVAGWFRLAIGWPAHAGKRLVAGIASVVACVILVSWALSGPLQPGWAKRAGTPPSLVDGSSIGDGR